MTEPENMKGACEAAAKMRLDCLNIYERGGAFLKRVPLVEVAARWKAAPLWEERVGWDRTAMVASAREALKSYSLSVVTLVYGASVVWEAGSEPGRRDPPG